MPLTIQELEDARKHPVAWAAYFPTLTKQRPPAPPSQIVSNASAPDAPAFDVPKAPPIGSFASSNASSSSSSSSAATPLPRTNAVADQLALKAVEREARLDRYRAALPALEIKSIFEDIEKLGRQTDEVPRHVMNNLAIEAAREIRVRSERQWPQLLAECAVSLASCARMSEEGTGAPPRDKRRIAVIAEKIHEVIQQRPMDTDAGRRQFAGLYAATISLQLLNEGNNRFAYFLLKMMSEFHNVPLPPQEKMANRAKIGFVANNIAEQFIQMY